MELWAGRVHAARLTPGHRTVWTRTACAYPTHARTGRACPSNILPPRARAFACGEESSAGQLWTIVVHRTAAAVRPAVSGHAYKGGEIPLRDRTSPWKAARGRLPVREKL